MNTKRAVRRAERWRPIMLALGVLCTVSLSCAGSADKPAPASQTPAPDSFRVTFETSRGTFVVECVRAWAPRGVDRFHDLVEQHFFDQTRFFRTMPGFVSQFGLSADPKGNGPWDAKPIQDDSVRQSNTHGMLTFASQGANTRTHQLFFNLVDNPQLDGLGFAPIGRVVEGLSVVDSLYSGYGDNPDQGLIQRNGNSYLDRMFPKLDYIKTARIAAGR
jgi:peptidyl-prolyl cis-trans isomerase A (cyclophilin A)